MPIPDRLAHPIGLFRHTGRVCVPDPDGFQQASWVSIFMGMGLRPERYDPCVDHIEPQALVQHFMRLRQAIAGTVNSMPAHGRYLEQLLGASLPAPAMGELRA